MLYLPFVHLLECCPPIVRPLCALSLADLFYYGITIVSSCESSSSHDCACGSQLLHSPMHPRHFRGCEGTGQYMPYCSWRHLHLGDRICSYTIGGVLTLQGGTWAWNWAIYQPRSYTSHFPTYPSMYNGACQSVLDRIAVEGSSLANSNSIIVSPL